MLNTEITKRKELEEPEVMKGRKKGRKIVPLDDDVYVHIF